jgi:hypothetical protein
MAVNHPMVPEEIVGIISAKSLGELWDLVDEICNPSQTEYAVLPSGGIIWEESAPKVSDIYRLNDQEQCVATIQDGKPNLSQAVQDAITDGLVFKSFQQSKPE